MNRQPPPSDLSFQPLFLLVPGPESRENGTAADLAVAAARRFSGGRPVVLIDLDPDQPQLSLRFADRDAEGIAEALAFGLSLGAVGRNLDGGVQFVPTGAAPPDLRELDEHPEWERLVIAARRRGARLLAYVPADPHRLAALARHAAAVMILGSPEEEMRVRPLVPAALPVVGVLSPTPATADAHGGKADPAADGSATNREPGWGQGPPDGAAGTPPAGMRGISGSGLAVELRRTRGLETTAESEVAHPPATAPPTVEIDAPPRETEPAPPADAPADADGSTTADPAMHADALESAAPEPPMRAPTARGLTLAEWLAKEEARLPGRKDAERHREVPTRTDDEPAVASSSPHPGSRPELGGETALPDVPEDTDTVGPIATASPAEPPLTEAVVSPPVPPPGVEAPPGAAPSRPAPEDAAIIDRAFGRYSVPVTSERRERLTRVAAVVILAYWTYYIVWRWVATLNPDALWFSIPLALAETWGWVTGFFLVFTVWRLNHRKTKPAPPGLSVDVFITTYDEPLEIIRRTTISAREIRYPHRTYVLDDGRRDEIRAMATELGVGYITRENNEHAKAGNLNSALRYTEGDFILQLDADHAPLPHILDRLLGFFDDPRVAFVQTPQDFYNIDSFTSDVDEATQRIWEEQKLFFAVIQPGKDNWNSAFFCGSCAVIRRGALDDIGGFSVRSVTEDIETSLLLHARGWRSVYLGESLAYGLAATSALAFHVQHGRWAQGAMQVLRAFNPITYPGLTLAQRISYFYSLSAYVVGVQKLIFYSAPIIFFLTGALPIRSLDDAFLLRFIPYIALSVLLVEMLSRGLGFAWIAERYQMAKFWTYSRALATFLTNRRLRFRVTPKGPGHVPFTTYAPQLTLMVVTVASVYWATFAYARGWVDYAVPGWQSLAFQLNFLWAVINFVLAGYVVRLSVRLQQQRQDYRFSDRFPIHIRPRGRQGRLGDRQLALTEDLNSGGVSFRSVSRFDVGTELKITLPLSTSEVDVIGTVIHVRPAAEPRVPAFVHGVAFDGLPLDVRDAIEIHCAHHAAPFKRMQYRIAGKVFTSRAERAGARAEPGRHIRLPTWVLLGEAVVGEDREQNVAFLDELGPDGASLIMNEAVAPGTRIVFEVPGTEIRGQGHTVYSRALETPIGVRFVVGVRMDNPEPRPTRPGGWRRAMRSGGRAGVLAVLAGAALAILIPRPGAAQLQLVVYGAAEADSRDQSLLLVGASVQSTRPGWRPVSSLLAYRVNYPAGAGTATLDALVPAVGVQRTLGPTIVQGAIGYLFLASDEASLLGAPGGAREGVIVQGFAEFREPAGATGQLAGSYNLGDSYLWTRARGGRRSPVDWAGRPLWFGAEAVFQGGRDQPGRDRYRSIQIGPLVEVQPSERLRLLAAAGWKSDDLPATRGGGFPYGKLELTYLP